MITLAAFVSVLALAYGQNAVPCGVPLVQPHTNRIVGGTPAVQGSWPWMLLIVDNLGYISGSGSIIHPNIVLTSAQHFEGIGYNVFDLNLRGYQLYAGSYSISSTAANEKVYHIRRVVLHPGYNTTSLENDIALIETVESIQHENWHRNQRSEGLYCDSLCDNTRWNDHTRPACIADPSHAYQVNDQCYLTGWGSTETTGNEETLNQLPYPILQDSVCANIWDDFLPNNEICAGYQNQTKDFCGDDIGSPLVCKDPNGAWYIQGIASSGGNCTTADKPGIFEDVTMYSDWIKRTMEEAGYPYEY